MNSYARSSCVSACAILRIAQEWGTPDIFFLAQGVIMLNISIKTSKGDESSPMIVSKVLILSFNFSSAINFVLTIE